jgi:hypothetical protein
MPGSCETSLGAISCSTEDVRALFHSNICCPSLTVFRSIAGIPRIYHFGEEALHSLVLIDPLGPNIEDLVDSFDKSSA